jgi:hypothetical protein
MLRRKSVINRHQNKAKKKAEKKQSRKALKFIV